ncbi:MAG: hypothetical protein ABIH04_05830 [Planctomycetota bacterium]
MRRNLIAVFMAGLAIFILSGCGNDTSTGNPEADKILDEMKFENAETLGPIARKMMALSFKGKWEEIWDMLPKKMHESMEQGWTAAKASPVDNEDKKLANEAGSAKEYFAKMFEKEKKSEEDMINDMKDEDSKYEVVREEFSDDGNTGWIIVKYLKTSEEKKKFNFTKEDGEWKMGW